MENDPQLATKLSTRKKILKNWFKKVPFSTEVSKVHLSTLSFQLSHPHPDLALGHTAGPCCPAHCHNNPHRPTSVATSLSIRGSTLVSRFRPKQSLASRFLTRRPSQPVTQCLVSCVFLLQTSINLYVISLLLFSQARQKSKAKQLGKSVRSKLLPLQESKLLPQVPATTQCKGHPEPTKTVLNASAAS